MNTTTHLTSMTMISEYETGAFAGNGHPHNGYYAGDFGPRTICSSTRSTRTRTTSAHRTLARSVSLPRR
jgi:hypothetical protein